MWKKRRRCIHVLRIQTVFLVVDFCVPGFWSSKQALDWVDAAKGDVSAAAWTKF